MAKMVPSAPPREREENALEEELPHEPYAARSERDAERDLAPPRGRAREEEIRDVGAGDEEDDADHPHEHQERGLGSVAQTRNPSGSLEQQKLLRGEALSKALRVGDALEIFLKELPVDDVRFRASFVERHSFTQTSHRSQPSGSKVLEHRAPGRKDLGLHHQGNVEVDRIADFDAMKPALRDADDGHGLPVHEDGASDRLGIARESPLPECVAQDHDRMAARPDVVLPGEDPAHGGSHSESLEEGAGNEVGAHALGSFPGAHMRRSQEVGEDAFEDPAAIAKSFEHRVGDRGQHLAVVMGEAGERARGVEDHEPFGIAHGQRTDQELIDEPEDRGIRTDAEREREDDDEGEPGALAEGS